MAPDTKEKRQAGMAAFRAQMLAAHQRMLKAEKPAGRKIRLELIATIKQAQQKFGEV